MTRGGIEQAKAVTYCKKAVASGTNDRNEQLVDYGSIPANDG